MADEIEKVLKHAVLVFFIRGAEVLLAKKSRLIGAGCWNGYGGGIEDGETPLEAAAREIKEEAGGLIVAAEALGKAAIVDFHNTKSDGEKFICRVQVFLAREWQGEPTETEEMLVPTWFKISSLPLDEMMPADRDWLPHIFQGRKIKGRVWYGPRQQELLHPTQIEFVDRLD